MTRRSYSKVTSIAFVGLVLGIATSSCGFLPKKVTKEECEKWGDKFATVAKEAFEKETKKCFEKATGGDDSKKMQKEAKKAANEQLDKVKETIVKGCSDQEGKNYISKDADCYMKASELKDWKTCSFDTPFFKDFSTMAESFSKEFQKGCDEGIDKGKKGGGGKKKGGDDD
jgi:hypothetical protein